MKKTNGYVDGMGKTVTDYKNDLKKLILEDGLEQVGQLWKAPMKRVVDKITDWEDIDQLYDAGRDAQNLINEESLCGLGKNRTNEYKTMMRKHYHNQIQFVLGDVTYKPEEHLEYTTVLVKYGCMTGRYDLIWSIANLSLKKLNEMVTELWKIKAHWMQKVDNGEVEAKPAMRVYTI